MKPGVVRCPLCKRPVKLNEKNGGLMYTHWATFGRIGGGFRTTANRCKGSNKRPEDVTE
jgi:hypothetical protein